MRMLRPPIAHTPKELDPRGTGSWDEWIIGLVSDTAWYAGDMQKAMVLMEACD
jgi:hypothetical protein